MLFILSDTVDNKNAYLIVWHFLKQLFPNIVLNFEKIIMMNSLAFKNEQKFEIPNAKFDNIHKIHLIEFCQQYIFATIFTMFLDLSFLSKELCTIVQKLPIQFTLKKIGFKVYLSSEADRWRI